MRSSSVWSVCCWSGRATQLVPWAFSGQIWHRRDRSRQVPSIRPRRADTGFITAWLTSSFRAGAAHVGFERRLRKSGDVIARWNLGSAIRALPW